MKIYTLSILAALSVAASAHPYQQTTVQRTTVVAPDVTVVREVPASEYRTHEVIYVDTADTSDEVIAPVGSYSDEATLIQMKGHPDDYSNRDLEKDARRTYNQHENIESDYGNEIQQEIIENRNNHGSDAHYYHDHH